MTIDRLVEIFQTVSLKHYNVKTFSTGENWEFAVDGDEIYQAFHLIQPFIYSNVSQIRGMVSIQCSFLLLDKTDVAEEGEVEMLEKARQTAGDIIFYINQFYQAELNIDSWTMTTVTEYSDNMDCGILCELNIISKNDINKCEYVNVFRP